MNKKFQLLMSAAVLGGLGLTAPAMAAPHGVKVGVLTCHVASGWGYVIASSRDLDCTYRPNRGEPDRYVGSMSKLGVDIGYTQNGVLIWDVVAPTSDTRARAHCKAIMQARPRVPRSAQASARMCSSAASTNRLRCSP